MNNSTKQELIARIDQFIVIEENYFSMIMAISVMDALADSYTMNRKELYKLWSERSNLIDKEKSDVYINIEYT